MKPGARIWWSYVMLAALPLTAFAWFYLDTFEESRAQIQLQNLSSIADKKTEEIASFIDERLNDAIIHSRRGSVHRALPALAQAYRRGGKEATRALNEQYRFEYLPLIERGYFYDVLLIDTKGNVVFSMLHEADWGSNVETGPLRDTHLAKGFRQAMQTMQAALTEFRTYEPSGNTVGSFVIAPVLEQGRPLGAMALQVNLDQLTTVVSDRTGMGRTGETSLALRIGDGAVFTAPLLKAADAAFNMQVPSGGLATPMWRALAGEHGQGTGTDYDGQAVLAAWRYLPDLHWGMVVKMDASEALATVHEMWRITLLALFLFLLVTGVIAWLINRRFLLTEEKLLQSEELFFKSYRSSPIATAIRRLRDDVIVGWNPAFEKLFGYTPDQLEGKKAGELPIRYDPEMHKDVLEKVARHDRIEGLEMEFQRASGESVHLLMSVDYLVLHDEDCALASFVDVSEIRQANDLVKQSLGRLNEAQRLAKLGSWTLDLRNNRLDWSDEIFRIFEIDKEKFGASYEAFLNGIHPDDRDAVNKAYTDSLANRTPYEITHRLQMEDGRIKYVTERCETLYDDDGKPILSRGTVQDITGKQIAENELQERRQLLDTVIENIPSMIFMKHADDLRFVMFNRAGEELLGLKREELLGKSDHDLFPEEQADFFTAKDREVLDSGFRDIAEETIDTPGGRRILHTRKIALRDAEGKPQYLLGISEDITERKQYENALKESNEHIQTIFDNVVDGIITINERGIVATFNKAAEHIFGYRAEEVTGRNVKMLMPNPYHDAHDGYLHNYLSTGVARVIGIGREVVGRRKDGSTFPMDLAVSEITRKGERMFIGLARDITERKRVERMKSEFVSTVSHELRTPLTSIAGALGLLAGGALGSLPEQAKSLVDIANNNSKRLTRLINDLLDMEKIAAGKMVFDMQLQALMPLVEQALEINQAYAEQYGVRYVLKERVDGVEVKIDGQRLCQVLANFLSNAAKFSPAGAEVEVMVRRSGWRVRVEVRDHGPGIPAEFRKRIFEKFSQADSSDTRTKGGTGLGLAISRELAERMGGRVGFDSTEGQGATFFIELPVLEREVHPEADTLPELPPDAPCILVVEDDAEVARMMELMLNRAGYRADVAGGGGEALALLAKNRYAAMTLDLMLPDISGLEVLRQVRHNPALANFPVIVASVKVEEGRIAINGEFSGISWLPKPIDGYALLASVKQVLPLGSTRRQRVLHVEDDPDLRKVVNAMAGGQFDFEQAASLAEAEAMLGMERYDVILLDIGLQDGLGWELLPHIRLLDPPPKVIILSGRELEPEEAARVEGVLLKTRVSARELLDVLGQRIQGQKAGGKA